MATQVPELRRHIPILHQVHTAYAQQFTPHVVAIPSAKMLWSTVRQPHHLPTQEQQRGILPTRGQP